MDVIDLNVVQHKQINQLKLLSNLEVFPEYDLKINITEMSKDNNGHVKEKSEGHL